MTDLVLRGASGASYGAFNIYQPHGAWIDVPGLYAFIGQQTIIGDWRLFYIGKAESFAKRMPPCHERWDEAVKRGATHIAAMVMHGPDMFRASAERDLINLHWPRPLRDPIEF